MRNVEKLSVLQEQLECAQREWGRCEKKVHDQQKEIQSLKTELKGYQETLKLSDGISCALLLRLTGKELVIGADEVTKALKRTYKARREGDGYLVEVV